MLESMKNSDRTSDLSTNLTDTHTLPNSSVNFISYEVPGLVISASWEAIKHKVFFA